MSKLFKDLNVPKQPFNWDSNMPVMWELHKKFLHDVIESPTTLSAQKTSALELLNMIEWFREEKYGIPEKPSNDSQQVSSNDKSREFNRDVGFREESTGIPD
jgi:hypothetical protein